MHHPIWVVVVVMVVMVVMVVVVEMVVCRIGLPSIAFTLSTAPSSLSACMPAQRSVAQCRAQQRSAHV